MGANRSKTVHAKSIFTIVTVDIDSGGGPVNDDLTPEALKPSETAHNIGEHGEKEKIRERSQTEIRECDPAAAQLGARKKEPKKPRSDHKENIDLNSQVSLGKICRQLTVNLNVP